MAERKRAEQSLPEGPSKGTNPFWGGSKPDPMPSNSVGGPCCLRGKGWGPAEDGMSADSPSFPPQRLVLSPHKEQSPGCLLMADLP